MGPTNSPVPIVPDCQGTTHLLRACGPREGLPRRGQARGAAIHKRSPKSGHGCRRFGVRRGPIRCPAGASDPLAHAVLPPQNDPQAHRRPGPQQMSAPLKMMRRALDRDAVRPAVPATCWRAALVPLGGDRCRARTERPAFACHGGAHATLGGALPERGAWGGRGPHAARRPPTTTWRNPEVEMVRIHVDAGYTLLLFGIQQIKCEGGSGTEQQNRWFSFYALSYHPRVFGPIPLDAQFCCRPTHRDQWPTNRDQWPGSLTAEC